MSDPQQGSIVQPPFFRIRNRHKVLYPSCCYQIPERSACIDDPITLIWDEKEKRYHITRKNNKVIRFDGVDAMEFRESWPTTEYVALSKEVCFYSISNDKECDFLFNKQKRESMIIVEDEETRRNDFLLDEIDEMAIII